MLRPAFDFHEFSHQASSFVRSTAVCSATFRRDLPLQLLNPYHIITAVNVLQAAAQLEVACLIFCVLRDERLSIDRSTCLSIFSGACHGPTLVGRPGPPIFDMMGRGPTRPITFSKIHGPALPGPSHGSEAHETRALYGPARQIHGPAHRPAHVLFRTKPCMYTLR